MHPVTGRKVLFVNPQFTVAIKNMDERESKSLLDILFQQAQIPEYQFRHHWAPHTLIMWDNRSTQHYAVNDYFPQRRYMERVTIKGGPVNGVPRAEADSVRKIKFAVPEELQCLINRWKPAQTAVVMDTSALAFGGPMQGTP